MIARASIRIVVCALLACAYPHVVSGEETDAVLVDFESAKIGEHLETWQEQGVTFALVHQPTKSKAKGRVMFFPHVASGRKGILNAIANESIPLQASFTRPVAKVELKLWGSTTSAATIKALNAHGEVVDEVSLDRVPVRQRPEDPVPMFEIVVQGKGITSIQVSGSQPGGFVAIDELRYHPLSTDGEQ